MTPIEQLLSYRWIAKGQNKDLYYKIKDQAGIMKKFFSEKLGYQMLVNPNVVKLEKMPAKAEIWMGIDDFNEKIQYIFLCMILMFLEDKEAEEQFILSELTEYIQTKYEEESIDWTLYQYRRHLIKVIKFCLAQYILKVNDGSEDNFAANYEGEVLYENTGLSRYFMRNFTQNILHYTGSKDFESSEWFGADENRGIIRRHRVYRKLLMSPAVYKDGEGDEDFAYIKQYRSLIAGDLAELFDCELQVHKTSAYLILGENTNVGATFPSENTLSDIVLLCHCMIQERIEKGEIVPSVEEHARVTYTYFQSLIEECKVHYGKGFNKTYREKTSSDFFDHIKNYMEKYGFIVVDENKEYVTLMPIIGKIYGTYPDGFLG